MTQKLVLLGEVGARVWHLRESEGSTVKPRAEEGALRSPKLLVVKSWLQSSVVYQRPEYICEVRYISKSSFRPSKETLLCGVIYRNVIPYSMRSRSSVVRGCVPYRGGSGFKPRLVHALRSNTEKRLKTGKNRYFFQYWSVLDILKIALSTSSVSL